MQAEVHGLTIGYDSFGDGALTVVLLHAFPLNREQWRPQAENLARLAHVRVVTLDLRGFGESAAAVGPTTMEQMAGDVFALLDTLGVGSVALGGLSMGGYVAFACLRLAPERVRGLILADTRAAADSPEARDAREATARYAEEHGSEAVLQRDIPRLFAHVTIEHHSEVIAQARRIAALNPAAGVASASRGMSLRPDSSDLLPLITCPTLIIVGEQDAITPISEARTLFERIPDAHLEVLTDAGHLSNLERPEAFTGAVARFLRSRLAPR